MSAYIRNTGNSQESSSPSFRCEVSHEEHTSHASFSGKRKKTEHEKAHLVSNTANKATASISKKIKQSSHTQ